MRICHGLLSVGVGFALGIVTLEITGYARQLSQEELIWQLHSFDLRSEFWQLILTAGSLLLTTACLVVVSKWPQRHRRRAGTSNDRLVMHPTEQPLNHILHRGFGGRNGERMVIGAQVADLSRHSASDHIRDFVAMNLSELDQSLDQFRDDQGHGGVAYATPVGQIDVLATRQDGGFVVIVVNDGRAGLEVCGRLLAQMSWVEQHLANKRPVSGIIVTRHVSDGMRYASSQTPHIRIFQYELDVRLWEAVDRPAAFYTQFVKSDQQMRKCS